MKRKLIIAQDLDKTLYNNVLKIIPDWQVIMGKDKDIYKNHLKDAEVIVGWKQVMADVCLITNSKLKWIQSWSAGVNNYPMQTLANKNILLTSATGVHAFPISETIIGLMLALTRRIHRYAQNQLSRKWQHEKVDLEMHGKTIGIIGVGAIGKETANIAKAFGMKVIGVRYSGRPEPNVDQMVKVEKLNDILPQCDYVVVTLPLTEGTYKLFGKEQFDKMKESSFFINIGRGEVVDESALINSLVQENIAGAGLDVFEKEPLEDENPLWGLDNVIITPHVAGSTIHYDERVINDIFLPNLINYLRDGKPNINLVDYHKGY